MRQNEVKLFFRELRYSFIPAILCFFIFTANGQSSGTAPSNPNVRLGQKALLDGDFKAAAGYLQKALPAEAGDANVVYMLGYSQFHSGELKKAIETLGKVVELRPEFVNAYYYRGKANNTLAVQTDTKVSTSNREKMLNAAIEDYAKAIALNPEDFKYFQNRAVAYRDLGIMRGTVGTTNYDKGIATDAYNSSIADFEQVLVLTPGKKDIQTEIKKAKVYRDNLK